MQRMGPEERLWPHGQLMLTAAPAAEGTGLVAAVGESAAASLFCTRKQSSSKVSMTAQQAASCLPQPASAGSWQLKASEINASMALIAIIACSNAWTVDQHEI